MRYFGSRDPVRQQRAVPGVVGAAGLGGAWAHARQPGAVACLSQRERELVRPVGRAAAAHWATGRTGSVLQNTVNCSFGTCIIIIIIKRRSGINPIPPTVIDRD